MKKTKINSEKLLLGLGGAGIVAAVAVIVFLISFSIGGPKPEANDGTTVAKQNATSQINTDGTTFNYVESTEGIAQVQDVVIDSSCREAVKVFADCFLYGKVEQVESLLPACIWDELAQRAGADRQTVIEVFKQYFAQTNVSATLGEGGTVSYDVHDVLVIEDTSAQEIRSAISSAHGIDISSVTDVYAVSMKMERTVNGETVSEIDEIFCVKIDGVWYLAERDSLAVYNILNDIING